MQNIDVHYKLENKPCRFSDKDLHASLRKTPVDVSQGSLDSGSWIGQSLELAAEVLAVGVALERMNSKHTPLGTL